MKSLIFHVKRFGFFFSPKGKEEPFKDFIQGCEIIHFKKDYFDGNAKTEV